MGNLIGKPLMYCEQPRLVDKKALIDLEETCNNANRTDLR